MISQIIFLAITFMVSAILGKIFIPVLKKLKVGQNERKEGPRSHLRKQGTPTMGGIMIIVAFVVISLTSDVKVETLVFFPIKPVELITTFPSSIP